jgi:hypothetical protein
VQDHIPADHDHLVQHDLRGGGVYCSKEQVKDHLTSDHAHVGELNMTLVRSK